MLIVTALLCVAIALALSLFQFGIGRVGWPLVLGAAAVLPGTVLRIEGPPYVGIAPSAPSLTVLTAVVLVVTVLVIWSRRRAWLHGMAYGLPLLLWLVLGFNSGWDLGSIEVSGTLVIVFGVLAFAAGYALCGSTSRGEQPTLERVALWASAICLFQLLVVIAQSLGLVGNRASGPQSSDLSGRAYGSMDHPDQLAKIMVLASVILLVSMDTSKRKSNTLAVVGTVAALTVTAATQGRASFVALLVLVTVWALLQPTSRETRFRRFSVLLGIFVVTWGASGALMRRFEMDPGGGARDQLTTLAMRIIADHAWIGLGPNSYVHRVGQFDALTATGVPVHNSFLLSAAELGIPGAILLWGPLIVAVLMAFTRVRGPGFVGSSARAVLALAAALLLIGWTGWGLLVGGVYPLLWFMLGFFIAGMRGNDTPESAPQVDQQRSSELVRS